MKRRPAVILYKGELDVVVSFITSQIGLIEATDVSVAPNSVNGLKKFSSIRTTKLATLEIDLVTGKIGELNQSVLLELDKKLRHVLDLY